MHQYTSISLVSSDLTANRANRSLEQSALWSHTVSVRRDWIVWQDALFRKEEAPPVRGQILSLIYLERLFGHIWAACPSWLNVSRNVMEKLGVKRGRSQLWRIWTHSISPPLPQLCLSPAVFNLTVKQRIKMPQQRSQEKEMDRLGSSVTERNGG